VLVPVGEEAEARRFHPVRSGEGRHERDVHLVGGRECTIRKYAFRCFSHGARLPALGAEALQNLGQRVTAGDPHNPHFPALQIIVLLDRVRA
jgi:hypothetical protein